MAAEPDSRSETFKQRIVARLAAAGCRLRYDKVALRLTTGVGAGIPQGMAQDRSIIFAIAAPIKHPAKTIAALTHLLRDLPAGELHTTVHGNEVHARRVGRASTDMPGVMGFVHNRECDPGLILGLAEWSFNDR